MSAIAGIYNLDEEPVSIDDAQSIMTALHKYPADDIQIWHNKNIFLGCHAQWITPESVGERNPYYDADRRLTITADAIIDNRDELFERLRIDRVQRKNMPDSQLILLAYDKWGEDAPRYLIGDFAFMIWDEKKLKLFGARDFSGRRTLYFFSSLKQFAFCTTINPLLTLPYTEKGLNEQWLAEFLAMPNNSYDVLDASSTAYKNIRQVPPAHTISINCNGVAFSRYCTLEQGQQLKLKSNKEYEEAFCDVFETAVTAMLRTHRHIGAQLSGGLDSSSVVSFAAKALRRENKELHTFSYVPLDDFKEWSSKYGRWGNEKPLIQSTVQYVGNITPHYLKFRGRDSISEIDDWLEILEMPYKFFENSFWLKGIPEAAYHQGVGVILSGQRGNLTISWGLHLEYYALLLKRIRWLRLCREIHQCSKKTGITRRQILFLSGKAAFPLIHRILTQNGSKSFPLLISTELAQRTSVLEKIRDHGLNPTGPSNDTAYQLRKKHFAEAGSWDKPGTVDAKLSLRYSLWNRDPTNDLRVIRFCMSVPEEQFVQEGIDRSLIRRSTANYLPDQVRLNRVRGLQTAEVIHRMAPSWNTFIEQIEQVCKDPDISQFLNVQVIKAALTNIGRVPHPEYVFNRDFTILGRSLIFYRFIKNTEGR